MPLSHLLLGVKTDPIECRYSYEWLFRIMSEEGAHFAQLGTFFELYSLPDDYFLRLRDVADRFGIRISSVLTAHRELGGFMRADDSWQMTARRNFERLIDVAALVGADSVGSNPGSVLRDEMAFKPGAIRTYLNHMKGLMAYAHQQEIGWLTLEPMSCLAEPPTLPEEIRAMTAELVAYHEEHPGSTARVGLCVDVAHGYADRQGRVVFANMELVGACIPYLFEMHLKNTDSRYDATFGFARAERVRGAVDVPAVRAFLESRAADIPVDAVIGYLEMGGPKTGRDYSDRELEPALRESLRYLAQVWPSR